MDKPRNSLWYHYHFALEYIGSSLFWRHDFTIEIRMEIINY